MVSPITRTYTCRVFREMTSPCIYYYIWSAKGKRVFVATECIPVGGGALFYFPFHPSTRSQLQRSWLTDWTRVLFSDFHRRTTYNTNVLGSLIIWYYYYHFLLYRIILVRRLLTSITASVLHDFAITYACSLHPGKNLLHPFWRNPPIAFGVFPGVFSLLDSLGRTVFIIASGFLHTRPVHSYR